MKEKLVKAMNDNQNSAMFVADGKLFSIVAHDSHGNDEEAVDLAQEIEEYPELKASLQRFVDNPDMKRHTAEELKELRREGR